MVRFAQFTAATDMRRIVPRESYDQWVHEGGYGGIALVAVGLLILLLPFRRRELWAWFAVAAMFLLYVLPTFVIPALRMPGWDALWEGIAHPGLASWVAANVLLGALMVAALALSLPSFLRRKGQ
jgi:hypothetical protein